MFSYLKTRLKEWDGQLRESFGKDISTPEGRRAAIWHTHLMDHAFLRVLWTNLDEIAPGVWRSNQPSPKRVKKYAEMGIKTILFLRGFKPQSFALLEEEACAEHGIKLVRVELAARNAPKKDQLLALLDAFEAIEKPFLMHCKSGADRAGLASVLYKLHIEGASIEEARAQLSFKYLHLESTRTGILDHFVDVYEADTAKDPMPIREWIETKYNQRNLAKSFAKKRGQDWKNSYLNSMEHTRTLLSVSGADRVEFLTGLTTNGPKPAGELAYAALLTPQGKYIADFFLLVRDDDILIDVATPAAANLVQRLNMYKLRADVKIAEAELKVSRGVGPAPEGALPDPRHPDLGWRHYCDVQQQSQTNWDAIRVAHCIPETGLELTPDTFILEAGFERLNGVDFKKGCYVGQEVTARMKHKTELRKGFVTVQIEGDADIGAEITKDGKPVGTLFTRAGDQAIAYLRFDRAEGELQAGQATIRRAD